MISYPLLLVHSEYSMLIGWYAEETVVEYLSERSNTSTSVLCHT